MSEDLVIRQVWPVPHGHGVISPFEASEEFSQDCWQANEVMAAGPSDLFYSFTRDGEEVVRLLVVDHPDLDPGYGVRKRRPDWKSTSWKLPRGAAAKDLAHRPSDCCASSIPGVPSSRDRPKARMPSGSPWDGRTCPTRTGPTPSCS